MKDQLYLSEYIDRAVIEWLGNLSDQFWMTCLVTGSVLIIVVCPLILFNTDQTKQTWLFWLAIILLGIGLALIAFLFIGQLLLS